MAVQAVEIDRLAHVVFAPGPSPRAGRAVAVRAAGVGRRRGRAKPLGDEPAVHEFLQWVLERASIRAEAYRGTALQRRLGACLRALRVTSAAEARAWLEERPELLPVAVSAVLLGVSAFFRDAPVFESLSERWLPVLAGKRRGLRVWSAGCADGQELYSVAMLLDEQGVLGESVLLGTDCRGDAVARAAEGLYAKRELQALEARRRTGYFVEFDESAQIRSDLRGAVRWEVGDLLSGAPAECWDMILFRNIAIYLNWESAQPVWQRVAASLAEGGLLVTGKAERPPDGLGLVRVDGCIYMKQSSERS
jgi:chemotaxis methyl-accepting protein methylase